MNDVFRKLGLWFWHLIPANPILVRVVQGSSKRTRHLWLRTAYLGALATVVLFSLFLAVGKVDNPSLSNLAKQASNTFKWASLTQLALMSFLAPIFTASAITQERDAQTFNILLSTPLTNAQIVFGSLLSRMYFLIMLLVAGLPIFLMTMVYGGVTTSQVLISFAISGATAVITGALAIFVAMSNVGTRRTIFSFYLAIALYLISVYLLGLWDRTWIAESAENINRQRMSWLTPLHPFLSLEVALNRVYAPPAERLVGYGSISRFALANPAAAYITWTLSLALMLTLFSVFFVRRSIKTGEATLFSNLFGRFSRKTGDELRRTPRDVWNNPVAWREAKTRAAGGGLIRWATAGAGLVGSLYLLYGYASGPLSARDVAAWLASITIVQFAITLIVATNTAATSMTKEREAQTFDILLTTPLTSRYIVWGKLRGLVSFAAPLLLVPIGALLVFGIIGLFKDKGTPVVWVETCLQLAAILVVFTALACVLGLRVSLISKKNVTAVMYSLGLLIVITGILTAAGFALVRPTGSEFGAFLAPFTPFSSIWYLVNPADLFDSGKDFGESATDARRWAIVGCVIALFVWTLFAWRSYVALVRDFDMTIRKQSATN